MGAFIDAARPLVAGMPLAKSKKAPCQGPVGVLDELKHEAVGSCRCTLLAERDVELVAAGKLGSVSAFGSTAFPVQFRGAGFDWLSVRFGPERERGMMGGSARPPAPTQSSQSRLRPAAAFVLAKSRGQNKLARILKPPGARQASRPAREALSPRRRRERQPKAARSPLRKRVSCRAGRAARKRG